MAFSGLTSQGKDFIISSVNAGCLSGKKTMPGVSFDKYISVYGKDPSSEDFVWKSNTITNPATLATSLIGWYNEYASIYSMNANVLAAQAFVESNYKLWTFSIGKDESTNTQYPAAMGLTQFVKITMNGVAAHTDSYNGITPVFTNAERGVLYKNTSPAEYDKPIILQNMMDNPKLMVKAQFLYMKYCANRANGLASSALFGYNRGDGYISKISYTDTIQNCKNDRKKKSSYFEEGVSYVFKTFSVLGDISSQTGYNKGVDGYFGYNFLKMDAIPSVKASEFDWYYANAVGSDAYDDVDYPKNYKISTHMTYYDAVSYQLATSTPARRKHRNIPNDIEFQNVYNLALKVYDPLCKKFNVKVRVSNAFRGEFLNIDVGGVPDSQHRAGEAMDIDVDGTGVTNREVFYYIANNLPFDQLIWEEGTSTNPGWVHVSLKLSGNRNLLTLYNGNSYLSASTVEGFNELLA
jgi:zinc D-Ala-D-Ala carboxypeptidase